MDYNFGIYYTTPWYVTEAFLQHKTLKNVHLDQNNSILYKLKLRYENVVRQQFFLEVYAR